jgi:hypothetical protein
MKNIFSNPLFHLAIVLFLVLGIEGYYSVAALSSPLSQPPLNTGNTGYPPLDTGSTTQTKIGSLFVGNTSTNAVGIINDGSLEFWYDNGGKFSKIFFDFQEPVVGRYENGSLISSSTFNSGWDYNNGVLYHMGPAYVSGSGNSNFQNAEFGVGASGTTYPLLIANKASSTDSWNYSAVSIGINGIVDASGLTISQNPIVIFTSNSNGHIELWGSTHSYPSSTGWIIDRWGDFYPDSMNMYGGEITAGTIHVNSGDTLPDRLKDNKFTRGKKFTWGDATTTSSANVPQTYLYYQLYPPTKVMPTDADCPPGGHISYVQKNGFGEYIGYTCTFTYSGNINISCPIGYFVTAIGRDVNPLNVECHLIYPQHP